MNIIITGAGGGLGEATVLALARMGKHRIVGVGRSKKHLDAVQRKRDQEHTASEFIPIVFDLTSDESDFSKKLRPQIEGVCDSIDCLINNAGRFETITFVQSTQKDWQAMIDVNLLGPMKLIRSLFSLMTRAPCAHIVNIGSMAGFQGSQKFAGLSAYSSSKASLACMTECLAQELPTNIRVNCLCFGSIATKMFRRAFPTDTAAISADEAGSFVANFALSGWKMFHGKIIPVTVKTP
ncbi:SDR family oxidoreductase [Candidatus Gottesmanbacteria bacterium]|nr:SDR family oxidoreductase [Candidatus Gottesmanbacteria bacterium]